MQSSCSRQYCSDEKLYLVAGLPKYALCNDCRLQATTTPCRGEFRYGLQRLVELGDLGDEALGIGAREVGQHNDGQPIIRVHDKCGAGATDTRHLPLGRGLQHRPAGRPFSIGPAV